MPSFCTYLNCHNLGSSSYLGYCNEYHMKRAKEIEPLMKIMEENKEIKSLAEARKFLTSVQRKGADPNNHPPS